MKKYILIVLVAISSLSNTVQANPAIAEKDLTAYLFVYFTGNSPADESIHYAVSLDGYHYYAIKNNQPILDSKKISSTGSVRDPHILRGEGGKTFYMVATDMRCTNGWDSNRAMVLLKSDDLIHWKSSVVNIQKKYKGYNDLKRVWAPQTIYDPEAKKYMIYWSMKQGDNSDLIYKAYANDDFTDLEGKPTVLFRPKSGSYAIDADIIKKDSTFYLFFKTEDKDGIGIKQATSKTLDISGWQEYDKYLQPTKLSVEGSCTFKLNHTNDYIMMYDLYRNHSFQFSKSCDLRNFKIIDDSISLDFHARHGTVMSITRSELKRILKEWGTPEHFPKINNNPVLAGYYADPEILYSHKTKKYYIYPTTDGITNWMGNSFKTFSSDNLVDWKDEGVILTLGKDVKWAKERAWAPCIVEKKIKGRYRYFYYFTADVKIGVAVANNPNGPFKDSGKPLIEKRPEGVNRGIVIDPDVFTDPKTNKSYLYWGNGFMAGAELNKDMISIKEDTKTILHPDHTFREGTYVFYRKGIYYFLWSQDDTRSPNYCVRYAMASSPLGKFSIPKNNIVIAKNPDKGILATGHNSILQIPDKDEWYIVYHRFSYPNGYKMGRAAGYNREVCIDKLEFNADGTIKQVTPTHEGVSL